MFLQDIRMAPSHEILPQMEIDGITKDIQGTNKWHDTSQFSVIYCTLDSVSDFSFTTPSSHHKARQGSCAALLFEFYNLTHHIIWLQLKIKMAVSHFLLLILGVVAMYEARVQKNITFIKIKLHQSPLIFIKIHVYYFFFLNFFSIFRRPGVTSRWTGTWFQVCRRNFLIFLNTF